MKLLPQRKGPVTFFIAGFVVFMVTAIIMVVVLATRR